jgi:endonuclease/exonuclease/phosphatase (EEP) superfamily protein YafD
VRKTFFAETVSMNMVMTGMLPVMLILAMHWPGSEEPRNPSFWFRMSVATIVGGVVAYPINHWLVANRLKHGCMTLPGSDAPAPGLGLVSPEPSMMMDHAQMQHATSAIDTAPAKSDHAMTELPSGRAAAIIVGTFAILLVAVWLTNLVVPVRF